MATTPAVALEDPDLPYNLTVMRAHDAARSMKAGLLLQQLQKDEFGMSQVVNLLKTMYEDR